MFGITLAALVAATPMPVTETKDVEKERICANYPVSHTYPYLVKDGYVMLHEADWDKIMWDYDLTSACLEFERGK